MTVRDVFELRRQGRLEEAYEAVRPMYAAHKGRYTTLCMFWTASDILKKRIGEQRFEEAEKIFKALLRVVPSVDDRNGYALSSIVYGALALSRSHAPFSLLHFLGQIDVGRLSDVHWRPVETPQPGCLLSRVTPSLAHQLLERAFVEIEAAPTADNALKAMPLLHEAVRRTPADPALRRYMSAVYRIMGDEAMAKKYE